MKSNYKHLNFEDAKVDLEQFKRKTLICSWTHEQIADLKDWTLKSDFDRESEDRAENYN